MSKKRLLDRILEEGKARGHNKQSTGSGRGSNSIVKSVPYDPNYKVSLNINPLESRFRLWKKDPTIAMITPDVGFKDVVMIDDRTVWAHAGQNARVFKVAIGADRQKKILRVWYGGVTRATHELYCSIQDHVSNLNGISEFFSVPKVEYFPAPMEGFHTKDGLAHCTLMDYVLGQSIGKFLNSAYRIQGVQKKLLVKVLDHLFFSFCKVMADLKQNDMSHGDICFGNLMVDAFEKIHSLNLKLVDLDSIRSHSHTDSEKIDVPTPGQPAWHNPHFDIETKNEFSKYWYRYSDFTPFLLLLLTVQTLRYSVTKDLPFPLDWPEGVDESLIHDKTDLKDPEASSRFKELETLRDDQRLQRVLSILRTTLGTKGTPPSKFIIEGAWDDFRSFAQSIPQPPSFKESEITYIHRELLNLKTCEFCSDQFETIFSKNGRVTLRCSCLSQPQCSTCHEMIFDAPDRNHTYYCETCHHQVDGQGKCVFSDCFACESITVQCKACTKTVTDFPVNGLVYCADCDHFVSENGECETKHCFSCKPMQSSCKNCGGEFPVLGDVDCCYECPHCEHFMDRHGECVQVGACMACQQVQVRCSTCQTNLFGYLPEHPNSADGDQSIELPCKTCRHLVNVHGECISDACATCSIFN